MARVDLYELSYDIDKSAVNKILDVIDDYIREEGKDIRSDLREKGYGYVSRGTIEPYIAEQIIDEIKQYYGIK